MSRRDVVSGQNASLASIHAMRGPWGHAKSLGVLRLSGPRALKLRSPPTGSMGSVRNPKPSPPQPLVRQDPSPDSIVDLARRRLTSQVGAFRGGLGC